MVLVHHSSRHNKSGIVLIATLFALMLTTALVLMFQTFAMANTLTLKRLAQDEETRMNINSVRELARPLIGEAFIEFNQSPRLSGGGAPYMVNLDEKKFWLSVNPNADNSVTSVTRPRVLEILVKQAD